LLVVFLPSATWPYSLTPSGPKAMLKLRRIGEDLFLGGVHVVVGGEDAGVEVEVESRVVEVGVVVGDIGLVRQVHRRERTFRHDQDVEAGALGHDRQVLVVDLPRFCLDVVENAHGMVVVDALRLERIPDRGHEHDRLGMAVEQGMREMSEDAGGVLRVVDVQVADSSDRLERRALALGHVRCGESRGWGWRRGGKGRCHQQSGSGEDPGSSSSHCGASWVLGYSPNPIGAAEGG